MLDFSSSRFTRFFRTSCRVSSIPFRVLSMRASTSRLISVGKAERVDMAYTRCAWAHFTIYKALLVQHGIQSTVTR